MKRIVKQNKVLYSGLKTPDGTVLESLYTHDYKEYTDKNGKQYMLDGGNEYVRYNIHGDEILITIYSDDSHETIREWVVRIHQTVGPVRIKDMSDNWLQGVIKWSADRIAEGYYSSLGGYFYEVYCNEEDYRKEHNIIVNETKSYKTGKWVPETYPTEEEFREDAGKEAGKERELYTDERAILALVEYAEENMLRDRGDIIWRAIERIFSSRLGKGEVPSVRYV